MSTYTVRPLVLWTVIGGFVVSAALAAKLHLEKRDLAVTIDSLQEALADAQDAVAAQADQVAMLETELDNLELQLAQTEQEVTRLQAEQRGYRRVVAQLTTDTEAMKAKLASIPQLKSAIRQAKATLRTERWEQRLARLRVKRQEDRLAYGNRGFLLRNGISTVASSARAAATGAKLHVRVLEPQLK